MKRRPRTIAPVVLLGAVGVVCWLVEATGLRFNLTPSVPVGVYRLTSSPPVKGDLVAVCLPAEFGMLGHSRRYLDAGRCPGGASPLLKQVGAAAGDLVEITSDGVFVNGVFLQASAPVFDSDGRVLDRLPDGELELAAGDLWVFSPHRDSWDSRFFGPLPRTAVLGAVRTIWTPLNGSTDGGPS